MRGHPFLNPIEAMLVRWLMKSPRIGYIAIKKYGAPVTWLLRDESDPFAPSIDDDEDEEYEEPASMLLERLYHAPDAQR